MPHPFITISSTTQTNFAVATAKINTIYMVGIKGSEGTALDNSITLVNSVADFNTLIGASSLSAPSYRFLRAIDPSVPVYFVAGKATGGSPTAKDHLIAGLLQIGKNLQLAPGIIVVPESVNLATSADTIAVFNAAQNLVSNSLLNWQYFHNLTLLANDVTKALAERALLISDNGHSSSFFGFGKDSNNNQIPASISSAAYMTLLNRTRRGYFAPAAFQSPIPYSSVDSVYLPKWEIGVNEYKTLVDSGINCIYKDGTNFVLCGTRTLSNSSSWRHINTRYAANDIYYRTAEVLKPYLFLPADVPAVNVVAPTPGSSEASSNADILSTLIDLLNQIVIDGAFTTPPTLEDGTSPNFFDITPRKTADGNLSLTIGLWLISTRERIELGFVKRG